MPVMMLNVCCFKNLCQSFSARLLVFSQFVCQREKSVHDSVVITLSTWYTCTLCMLCRPNVIMLLNMITETLGLLQKISIMLGNSRLLNTHTKQSYSNPGVHSENHDPDSWFPLIIILQVEKYV